MSLVSVNGDATSTFIRDNVPNLISLNEDETDSGLGSSHSNSTHSPDMSADREGRGEESFEDYGAAEEQEPELLEPFGDKKTIVNLINSNSGTFNRTASVRRSIRRPSPATVRRTPSFGFSSSSMKGSPGTHPPARYENDDPDADDWNSVDSFQREDDVYQLTQQMEKLQNQVSVLVQSQVNQEDNVSKLKQDNAALTERCLLLEEQLKDQELKYEERLKEDHRKNMDHLQRLERDKQLELEHRNTRVSTLEAEVSQLRTETFSLQSLTEKMRLEKSHYNDRLSEAERQVTELSEENSRLKEASRREREEAAKKAATHEQEAAELHHELEMLKAYKIDNERYAATHSRVAPERVRDLEQELQRVKQENIKLEEVNQDLNLMVVSGHIQEGKSLLQNNMGSLFSEFTDSSKDEVNMLEALREQQEVNRKLKDYVDRILVDILERAPHLLEVRGPK
ncbi:hypothetical protein RvY_01113 [Ramazzottius varieornatus]|uniref:FIP-RBD domain-containing protein n=1 Tax=Ramazzottius varieornatus TaxID=947166 RepID=A0A1D1UJ44_RAMVA|nr:hypothetical protein RvY_01113 [Ramazzottius varieornatus]